MSEFVIRVIETRDYSCDYTIAADTEAEAVERAAIGETDSEYEGEMLGVTARQVMQVLSADGEERPYEPDPVGPSPLDALLAFVQAKAEAGRILWEDDAPVFFGLLETLRNPQ